MTIGGTTWNFDGTDGVVVGYSYTERKPISNFTFPGASDEDQMLMSIEGKASDIRITVRFTDESKFESFIGSAVVGADSKTELYNDSGGLIQSKTGIISDISFSLKGEAVWEVSISFKVGTVIVSI